ncbi:MAG: Na+/H+ antiporter NhaA [Bacteroidota bacterium]|nr:Na+/H+ antiporter NhaA [Bacteroidota bacterium]
MEVSLSKLLKDFIASEKTGGFILIACTVVSILIANSGVGEGYVHFWHLPVGAEWEGLNLNNPIEFWINDGLMAIFFLLVGLEIEREIYIGELSNFKNALLPVLAAVGGMAVPALFHYLFNNGLPTQNGIGIPMATDIAFALGVLSLIGNRVPTSIKIFLTALAIIDDLGAIIIIAIFYTKGFSLSSFIIAMSIFGGLLVLNRLKVHNVIFYLIPGVFMWYFMHESGVHATITGVLLAFAIPFGNGDENSPSYRLQHVLHKPVAFIILPIFALANTGIVFNQDWYAGLTTKNSLGILFGLVLGKPIGILLLSFLAIKLGISRLPENSNWLHILGAGILAGIGFTMSIFITLLAFEDQTTITNSKIAVLAASILAGSCGYVFLRNIRINKVEV